RHDADRLALTQKHETSCPTLAGLSGRGRARGLVLRHQGTGPSSNAPPPPRCHCTTPLRIPVSHGVPARKPLRQSFASHNFNFVASPCFTRAGDTRVGRPPPGRRQALEDPAPGSGTRAGSGVVSSEPEASATGIPSLTLPARTTGRLLRHKGTWRGSRPTP